MSDARADNLRHLRFLHFALIATSVLVLVGSSLRSPARVETAQAQARLLQAAAAQLIEHGEALRAQSCAATLSKLLGQYEASSPALGRARRIGADVELAETDRALLTATPNPDDTDDARTLGSLAAIWDAHHDASSKYTIALVDDMEGLYSVRTIKETRYALGGSPVWGNEQLAVTRGRFEGTPHASGSTVRAALRHNAARDQYELTVRGMAFHDLGDGTTWTVNLDEPLVLPVAVRKLGDVQGALIEALDIDAPPGTFAASFPALADVARGLHGTEIGALAAHLQHRADREAQSVGLLVGSMPLRTLCLWGALLLCCVQAYFVLHLSQHRDAVRKALEGGGFPWIATYRSFICQAATVTTAIVLPAGVVIYVALLRRGEGPASAVGTVISWVLVAVSVAGAAAAFVELMHVHRPDVIDDSATDATPVMPERKPLAISDERRAGP